MNTDQLAVRARRHAALGDPLRLAIIDELRLSDRSPSDLSAMLGVDSNLLAHHTDILEEAGLVERVSSQGDRRRRYVRLVPSMLGGLDSRPSLRFSRIVFICTENVARSQLAAAMWNHLDLGTKATSGGTRPGKSVHPAAIKAAARRGLDLRKARPGPVPDLDASDLVITVCDRAYESLCGVRQRLHWSVPDPVASSDASSFDAAAEALDQRIRVLSAFVNSAEEGHGRSARHH
jgi:protein-tyrosine-phosphatase